MDADDLFSDDEFSDIADATLNDLENTAISLTQQQRQPQANASNPLLKKLASNAATLRRPNTSSVNTPYRPPLRSQQHGQTAKTPAPASATPTQASDYGLDDGDVIDLDGPPAALRSDANLLSRSRVPDARPTVLTSRTKSRSAPDPETEAIYAAADAELGSYHTRNSGPQSASRVIGDVDSAALQSRIEALEKEHARLRQSEKEAQENALAKQGEVAIVRANQEKVIKEYERRMAVMQKLHAEESAKQRAEMEASRKEREKMETDNRFLQHDLVQETHKVKRVAGVPRKPAVTKPEDSPRKRSKGLGDGFADEEISFPSPSKSRDRPRDQTPKAGAKRKRNVNDSPAAPLSFSQPRDRPQGDSLESFTSAETALTIVTNVRKDVRYDTVQRILDYRPSPKHKKSIQVLMTYFFPSSPERSLSAILLDALSSLPANLQTVSVAVVEVLLELWIRCLQEKFHRPVRIILDLIRFMLDFELPSTSTAFIERAIPVCIQSIEAIQNPRARAANNPTFAAGFDWEASHKLAQDLQIGEVLDFLLYLAQSSTLRPDRNEVFWRYMTFDVTNIMLNKANPLEHIITGLQIIRTSCRSSTFGAISQDTAKQPQWEHQTISRMILLMFETPDSPKGEPPYEDDELAELTLEILRSFEALCMTEYGCLLLAQHRSAVGKMFQALEIMMRKVYILMPSATPNPLESPSAHTLVVQSVNLVVRLLYHILHTHADLINIQQKLSIVHGGSHKFLVGLTRVAFSEQLVLDAGIEDEVRQAAHSILDNVLSPEEGEAVVKALETPRGTVHSIDRYEPQGSGAADDTILDDAPG